MAQQQQKPTESELAILRVLWENGASTVREVHELLPDGHSLRYTTVLKTMQIMADKTLVQRDVRQRSHVYRARLRQSQVQRRFVRELIGKLFGGSSAGLAMRALSSKPPSPSEIQELRELLNELEQSSKTRHRRT